MTEVRDLLFQCDCHAGHFVKVSRGDEDWDTALTIYDTWRTDRYWWNRIRTAWRVLTKGCSFGDVEVVLTKDQARALARYLRLTDPEPKVAVTYNDTPTHITWTGTAR